MSSLRNIIGRIYHRSMLFRRVFYFPLGFLDIIESIIGKKDPLIPPRRINVTGRGNFREIGREFLRHFIKYGGLKPTDKVLDVGSGIGRMAVALTGYLHRDGSYDGFDIVPSLVLWAQKNITPQYPNFQFQHFNAYNKLYNPDSIMEASRLEFPYNANQFDFVFLTSVFTHMLPKDMEHYLEEIARVMRPGGKCLITYFLINAISRKYLLDGKSKQSFQDTGKGYWVIDKKVPEANVGYEEQYIRELYDKFGLMISGEIHYGLWSGRNDYVSYQDIIVAEKSH